MKNTISIRKPAWLKRGLPKGAEYEQIRALIADSGLHTVCQAARCPNQFECFGSKTATFMIMGDQCTRNCRFCNVESGTLLPPDPDEPVKVARAVKAMGLKFAVVTSVTRDDLPDGGASIFADTIRAIQKENPGIRIEVLIPDFKGDPDALKTVLDTGPDVLNHNIETVPRLYPAVRPQAVYARSLELISRVAAWTPEIPAKSGMMLGLGETDDEIAEVLEDLKGAGCRILTIGQYLQPSAAHLPVKRFVPLEEFDAWKSRAMTMGFDAVAAGPFVRSSYQAGNLHGSCGSKAG